MLPSQSPEPGVGCCGGLGSGASSRGSGGGRHREAASSCTRDMSHATQHAYSAGCHRLCRLRTDSRVCTTKCECVSPRETRVVQLGPGGRAGERRRGLLGRPQEDDVRPVPPPRWRRHDPSVQCGSLRERTLPQQRGAQSSEGGCAVLLRTWVRGSVCECECMSVTVSTGVCMLV